MKHHVMLDGDIGPLCCESQTALNQRIGVGDHFSCGNRMDDDEFSYWTRDQFDSRQKSILPPPTITKV